MSAPTSYLAPENSVSILRGTTKTFVLTVTAPDLTPVNLTGGKLVMTVKKGLYEDLPLVQKLTTDSSQGAITKPREGLAEFYFEPRDTQGLSPMDYIFDVWLITSSGDRYAVVTPTTFRVLPGVTYLPI